MKTIMDRNGNWVEYKCTITKQKIKAGEGPNWWTHNVMVMFDKQYYFMYFSPEIYERSRGKSLNSYAWDVVGKIFEVELRSKGLI